MKVIGLGSWLSQAMRLVSSVHYDVPENTELPEDFVVVDTIIENTDSLVDVAYDMLSNQMVLIPRKLSEYELLIREVQDLKTMVSEMNATQAP